MTEPTEKPLQHWWLAAPIALLLPALFLGWPYVPSSIWWTRSWGEVRFAVFLLAGTIGLTTTLLLSRRGKPPRQPALGLGLFSVLLFLYVCLNHLRFPLLVWAEIATLDCARPLATGYEAAVWLLGAPLAEEMAYRVLPLSLALTTKKTSVVYATLALTSLLFASTHTHLPLSGRFDIGVTGVFLGLVFLQTSKWWAPVLAHSAVNAAVMAAEWGWNNLGYPWCD